MATSDRVYTWHLYFQERDGKDQRKTQMQTLRVNQLLGVSGECLVRERKSEVLGNAMSITSGATPADYKVVTMAAEPLLIITHSDITTSIGRIRTHDRACRSIMLFTIRPLRLSKGNFLRVIFLTSVCVCFWACVWVKNQNIYIFGYSVMLIRLYPKCIDTIDCMQNVNNDGYSRMDRVEW